MAQAQREAADSSGAPAVSEASKSSKSPGAPGAPADSHTTAVSHAHVPHTPDAHAPHTPKQRFAHTSRRSADHDSILVAHAGGPNPDRLLVVGGGVGLGSSAEADDHALATKLATALTELTGRGTNIEVLISPDVSHNIVHTVVDRRRMLLLDAIIVIPGDINSRMPPIPSQTRRRVDAVLNHIREQAPLSLHVFVLAAPPLSPTARIWRPLRWLAALSIKQLNRTLDAACSHRENVELISLAGGELTALPGTPNSPSLDPLYVIWAQTIALRVSEFLEPRNSPRG